MNRRRFALVTVLTFVLGVALRCLPLLRSPLPFNPDGVLYAGDARRTLAAGHVPLAGLAPDALSFTAFVATVAEVTGVHPALVAQPTLAVVGAMPILLGVGVTLVLARRIGFGPGRARFAASAAGALLAVEGLYLHRSMPVEEQTLGLFVVPLALVAVGRAYAEGSRRWYAVAAVALASLPPLHNLDSMVAALALTLFAGFAVVRDRTRRALALLSFALGFWTFFVGYMEVTQALTPTVIIQSERITRVPGLLVAWLVLAGALLLAWTRTTARRQRLAVLAVGVAWFAILLVNAFVPVFPGTPATPTLLYVLLAPLALLFVLASVVVPRVAVDRREGLALSALFAAVSLLVGLSLTASLTPEYVSTIYRSLTFVHFPVLVVAALGLGALVRSWRPARRPGVRAALVALVLVSAAASVPVAVSGLSLLPYKGVTTPAELSASGFATDRAGNWTGDDHLVRIAPYHDRNASGARAPSYRWLSGGESPRCPTLMQESWTTTGAQFFPAAPSTLAGAAFERSLTSRNLVFATASGDPVYLVTTGSGDHAC